MPRTKRGSKVLDRSLRRAAAMKSIDPNLDLGNGLSISAFWELIQDTQENLDNYNTLLSTLDQLALMIQAGERSVAEMSERMLTGVAFKYGRYSDEYVMAGGRQRPRGRQRRVVKAEGPEVMAVPKGVAVPEVMAVPIEGVNGSNGATVK